MRRPLIAGNWKMNGVKDESLVLAKSVLEKTDGMPTVDVAICTPFVYLDAISGIVKGTHVKLGAQNVYFEKVGAFTGEISAKMLVDVGCIYVILGHSERRTLLGETDEVVSKKTLAALANGLTPIVCLGETLAQREAGETNAVIEKQFVGSYAGLTDEQVRQTVIAYEPVWAIGTGKTATSAQAEDVHSYLRTLIEKRYNRATADTVRILYGGSMNASNANELLAQPNIDGGLIGGASLKPDDFAKIVAAGRQKATS